MTKVLHITTEGDEEGRTSKSLGYFVGNPTQAIAHLVSHEVRPAYSYYVKEFDIVDVSKLQIGSYEVIMDATGKVTRLMGDIPEELKVQGKLDKILKSLSNDDKMLLENHYYN